MPKCRRGNKYMIKCCTLLVKDGSAISVLLHVHVHVYVGRPNHMSIAQFSELRHADS